MSPKFSLIVVNYNSATQTLAMINSFLKNHTKSSVKFEIVIVDNHSKPADKNLLKDNLKKIDFGAIKTFFLPTNIGFGQANNLAVKHSRGEFLLFLNPDTICLESLAPLFTMLEKEEIGIVAPQLVLSDGRQQAEAQGDFPNLLTIFKKKLFFLSIKKATQPKFNNEKKKKIIRCDWLSAGCFACRKNLFELLGGFDPQFFMYFEDIDLCRRASNLQKQNYLLPSLSVIHLGGERKTMTRARRRAYFSSQKKYFQSWHPWQLPLLLFFRFPYQVFCFLTDSP